MADQVCSNAAVQESLGFIREKNEQVARHLEERGFKIRFTRPWPQI